MKHRAIPIALALLLAMAAPAGRCQEQTSDRQPLALTGYGFFDTHYATGSVGGGALLLDWRVAPSFRLGGGMEYAKMGASR